MSFIVGTVGPLLLVSWRKKHGITQTEAGKRFGVTKAIIGHWEGSRSEPSEEQVIDIERVTGIQAEDWLCGARMMRNAATLKELRRSIESKRMSTLCPRCKRYMNKCPCDSVEVKGNEQHV